MRRTRFASRALALAMAVALTAGAAACGDSDDGDGGGDRAATETSADVERRIQAGLDQLRRDFRAGEPGTICGRLTPRGRAETAATVDGAEDCPDAVATVLEAYGDRLHSELTVVRLRVDGERAVATLRSETGNTYPSRFALDGDRWRMDQSLLPGDG